MCPKSDRSRKILFFYPNNTKQTIHFVFHRFPNPVPPLLSFTIASKRAAGLELFTPGGTPSVNKTLGVREGRRRRASWGWQGIKGTCDNWWRENNLISGTSGLGLVPLGTFWGTFLVASMSPSWHKSLVCVRVMAPSG